MSLHEHMEHAAHAGHSEHKDPGHAAASTFGRNIGITMAILGVLVALCSAMLGGTRAKFTGAMVEQSTAASRYQASSTKYRLLMSQLQQLHALMPTDARNQATAEKELDTIQQSVADSQALSLIRVQRLEAQKILNTVTPNPVDVLRFVKLARDYEIEKKGAQVWMDAYHDVIHTHEHGAHRYEYALLCAEFGIVICAIALLLTNRIAWFAAAGLGVASAVLVVHTIITYLGHIDAAEAKITVAANAFEVNRAAAGKADGDIEVLEEIEKSQTAAVAAMSLPAPAVPKSPIANGVVTSTGGLEQAIDKGIRKVSESSYEIDKALLAQVLADPTVLLKGVRMVPTMNEGKAEGFKLFAIMPGSVFAKLGLNNGDTIRALNGFQLTSADESLEAYAKLRDTSPVKLAFTRNGKSLTFTYSVK